MTTDAIKADVRPTNSATGAKNVA